MSDYWSGNITGTVKQVNAQISGSQRGDILFSDVQDVKEIYTNARTTVFEEFKNVTDMSSYDSFLQSQAENLSLLSNSDIEELQRIFDNEKSESFEEALMEEIGDPHVNDDEKSYYDAVIDGKYLPNRVIGNRLDKYHTPNYNIKLFLMDKQHVIEMHNDNGDDERNPIGYDVTLADPDKQVVLAQTGVTDITIDNLNIEHFSNDGSGADPDANRSVPAAFSFTLTEPGSVTFLDRLAAAQVYCGFTEQLNSGEASTQTVVAGGSQIPFYLQVSFHGYPDNADENDESVNEHLIGRPFVYELGYLKFDMQITPEGAVYNCTSHSHNDISAFPEYHTLKTEIVISGNSISLLMDRLQNALNDQLKKKKDEGKDSGNDGQESDATGSKAKTEYTINYKHIFKSKDEVKKVIDGKGDGNVYQNEDDHDGRLSDRIYLDPDRVTPVSLANTPEWYQTPNPEATQARSGYNDGSYVNSDIGAQLGTYAPPGAEEGDPTIVAGTDMPSSPVSSYISQDGSEMDQGNQDKVRLILSDKSMVTLRFPKGKTVKDCLFTILSLSYDFMKDATRLVDFEDPSKGVDFKKTFVNWFDINGATNIDYSVYDKDLNKYKARIEYSVDKVKSPRTDVGISGEEFKPLTDAEIVTSRVQDLNIVKEYLYMFTGLNDQIIQLELNFNEAFALRVPYYGIGNPIAQLAYASAGDLTLDEAAEENPLINSPSDKLSEDQRKSNILDFLKDLEDNLKDGIDSLTGSLGDLLNENASGISRELIEGALLVPENENEEQRIDRLASQDMLAQAIAQDDQLRIAVNAAITKNRISEQTGAPTESDENTEDETSDEDAKSVIPVFASQIVPGLEGPGDDPRIAERFGSILDDQIKAFTDKPASNPPNIQIDTHSSSKFKPRPVERGSIRSMAFAHLMSQHSGAVATQKFDVLLRGDPWWWGKGNFYKKDKSPDINEYVNDLEGAYYDSGGPLVLIMIEAPRKLDFNTEDEDQNTGFYDFGHINYTMSGIYRVVRTESILSNGTFETSMTVVREQGYDVSKIEKVKEIVKARIEERKDQIKNKNDGMLAQVDNALAGLFTTVNRLTGGNLSIPTASEFLGNEQKYFDRIPPEFLTEEVLDRFYSTSGIGFE